MYSRRLSFKKKNADLMLTKTLDKMNREAHAHSCIMGNQGKMAGNKEICIRIPSRLFLLEFMYLMLSI